MAKPTCLFIGGFSNSTKACREFAVLLSKETGWRVKAFTFRDAVQSPKKLMKYADSEIVFTHSASIFMLEELKLMPKLVIAHAPPSNIRKREFIYRYLTREAKKLFSLEGPILGGGNAPLSEVIKLPQQITDGDLESLLAKYDDWVVLSPAKDPMFRAQDYPVDLQNHENFVVVEGSHDAFLSDYSTIKSQLEEKAKATL